MAVSKTFNSGRFVLVLILVIVDVVLMDFKGMTLETLAKGLNPCYSGCCSDGGEKEETFPFKKGES